MLLYPPMDSAFHQACSRGREDIIRLRGREPGSMAACAGTNRQELHWGHACDQPVLRLGSSSTAWHRLLRPGSMFGHHN